MTLGDTRKLIKNLRKDGFSVFIIKNYRQEKTWEVFDEHGKYVGEITRSGNIFTTPVYIIDRKRVGEAESNESSKKAEQTAFSSKNIPILYV